MAPPGGESVGVELLQKLTAALERNTAVQVQAGHLLTALGSEIMGLREDIAAAAGVSDDLCGHLSTSLRVLDSVSEIGGKRPPSWTDVRDVLQEIKEEIEAEAGGDDENDDEPEEVGDEPAPVQRDFPKKS